MTAQGRGTTALEQGTTPRGDRGSAMVEFLVVALLLLVPTVYLVAALSRVQAATFAAEGAARSAGRAFVTSPTAVDATARAVAAVGLALTDQGFDDPPERALAVACRPGPCLSPGSAVVTEVRVEVDLPGMPAVLADLVPAVVPVSAVQVTPVDAYGAYRGSPP